MFSWQTFVKELVRDIPYLVIIVGDRGSGKTNLSLLIGEILLSAGIVKTAYVTLPTSIKMPNRLAKGRYLTSTERLEEHITNIYDAYIVLDEGLISINARSRRKRLNNLLIGVTAVGRHRGLHMTITTQAHRVDVQIRELADAVVIKKTSLARLVLLDRPPRRIKLVDKALRKVSGRSVEDLSVDEAVRIGTPVTSLIYDIPIAKLEPILDKRARNRDIVF